MTQREDTMRRLGALMLRCPQCHSMFLGSRYPRYWIVAMFEGEPVDHEVHASNLHQQDLCCSNTCLESYCKHHNEKRQLEEPGTLAAMLEYLPHVEEESQQCT